jgi:hypothetical protein
VLFVAGIVLATTGAAIAGMAAATCGAILVVSWGFLLVGLSEDRDRERERPEEP